LKGSKSDEKLSFFPTKIYSYRKEISSDGNLINDLRVCFEFTCSAGKGFSDLLIYFINERIKVQWLDMDQYESCREFSAALF